MNFQDLKKVETADTYLDMAFSKASKRADLARAKKAKDRLAKSQFIESTRIQNVAGTLQSKLEAILKAFPSIDSLPDFYLALIKATIDYPRLKKSLGALNWAVKKIGALTGTYTKKITRCPELGRINSLRTEHYGRVSSVMKQIRTELVFLESARKTMKGFPTIKTSMFTVAICGFPNVGKTTLLSRLTGSKPEINSYAFTTKRINVGYMAEEKVQLLDTPGTLNRKDKMNYIETMADLAMKHCSHAYVYIFDLTEPYPIKDQIKLYRKILKDRKETITYFSKTDIISPKKLQSFMSEHHGLMDAEILKRKIIGIKSRTFP